jgi:hypothetical protein
MMFSRFLFTCLLLTFKPKRMNPSSKISIRTILLLITIVAGSSSGFSQHFSVLSYFGAGQASGEFDSKKFAFTSEIGCNYETKSEIISFSAALKSESYNFNEEVDLMVFSLPLGCEVHPRTNPKPYFGISLATSYPTQQLLKRYFFLTGGLTGGIAYDFRRLTTFAQFEYLADMTGYNRSDDTLPASQVDKYYLNRYYVSLGVKIRL